MPHGFLHSSLVAAPIFDWSPLPILLGAAFRPLFVLQPIILCSLLPSPLSFPLSRILRLLLLLHSLKPPYSCFCIPFWKLALINPGHRFFFLLVVPTVFVLSLKLGEDTSLSSFSFLYLVFSCFLFLAFTLLLRFHFPLKAVYDIYLFRHICRRVKRIACLSVSNNTTFFLLSSLTHFRSPFFLLNTFFTNTVCPLYLSFLCLTPLSFLLLAIASSVGNFFVLYMEN